MTGSALYQRTMAWYDTNDRDPELQHKVWDKTPWMLDVYTGDDDRMRAIMDWARERFGDEAWPIHGKPGTWTEEVQPSTAGRGSVSTPRKQ